MSPDPSIPLSETARMVLASRYQQRDADGRLTETPAQLFRRVADNVAAAEARYGDDPAALADAACGLMARLEFLPNSPTLMNAGLDIQQLSACFVLPVEDSLAGIFDTLKYTALIHQSGGGTGFSFSRLRPAQDVVQSTHGVASGPLSFMRVFDAATEAIKQGGTRRGANMAILAVDHPDIEAFIDAKTTASGFTNFNLSVAVTDAFMHAVERGADYALHNPRTGLEVGHRPARDIFQRIAKAAWTGGDPGIVFLDRINRDNPTPHLGAIESTNPCGEQPLLPYESCTLGSIDVSKFALDGDLDWERLGLAVGVGVRFLDDVIDVNRYPSAQIAQMTMQTRKVGLGVMGFADLLYRLGVAYNSDTALQWAERVMDFIRQQADTTSEALGVARGPFPAWRGSVHEAAGRRFRNATRTTVAPTGTLSIIAGCSGGIEPVYALAFVRHQHLERDDPARVSDLTELHPDFRAAAEAGGWWSAALRDHLLRGESLQTWPAAPPAARRLFVTAHDLTPAWHVRMQAAFQRHVDNAVSKTVNFGASATPDDISLAYLLAWHEGCKGITVYRDRSRNEQVFSHLDPTPEDDWHTAVRCAHC